MNRPWNRPRPMRARRAFLCPKAGRFSSAAAPDRGPRGGGRRLRAKTGLLTLQCKCATLRPLSAASGPEKPGSPVVVSVPHAGRAYSEGCSPRRGSRGPGSRASRTGSSTGWSGGRSKAGRSALIADAPRAEIDLNRDERELDPAMVLPRPRGQLDGRIRPAPAAASASSRPGSPARARSGGSASPRPRWPGGSSASTAPITPRSKRNCRRRKRASESPSCSIAIRCRRAAARARRRSCSATATAEAWRRPWSRRRNGAARAAGFKVARNAPYAGGHITERHGRPSRGVHALQLELDRSLYLAPDLRTHRPRLRPGRPAHRGHRRGAGRGGARPARGDRGGISDARRLLLPPRLAMLLAAAPGRGPSAGRDSAAPRQRLVLRRGGQLLHGDPRACRRRAPDHAPRQMGRSFRQPHPVGARPPRRSTSTTKPPPSAITTWRCGSTAGAIARAMHSNMLEEFDGKPGPSYRLGIAQKPFIAALAKGRQARDKAGRQARPRLPDRRQRRHGAAVRRLRREGPELLTSALSVPPLNGTRERPRALLRHGQGL